MLRRSLLSNYNGGGGVKSSQAVAGDILLYDSKKQTKVIIRADSNLDEYPASRFTPIGVVVVPGTHDVYGTGECGVMSIVPMNCSTPETGGTSEQSMYWGVYGTDISGLYNYNQVVHDGNYANLRGVAQGVTDHAYLPSDKLSVLANPYDTKTGYAFNDNRCHVPSPYNNNGTFNFAYAHNPSSIANAMSDFDGVGNTNKIIAQRGSKANGWKPTYNTQTDYPAASCCRLFHTDGTNSGSWYLPACGELGYIMPRFNAINQSIAALRTAYGVGVQLDGDYSYWSSSEYSSYEVRHVHTHNGHVHRDHKDNVVGYVRAWLRVGA